MLESSAIQNVRLFSYMKRPVELPEQKLFHHLQHDILPAGHSRHFILSLGVRCSVGVGSVFKAPVIILRAQYKVRLGD